MKRTRESRTHGDHRQAVDRVRKPVRAHVHLDVSESSTSAIGLWKCAGTPDTATDAVIVRSDIRVDES